MDYKITIDKFATKTTDGTNKQEILNDINLYVSNYFEDNDKNIIIPLIIIDILGIIALCLTINIKVLSILLVIIIFISIIISLRNKIFKQFCHYFYFFIS